MPTSAVTVERPRSTPALRAASPMALWKHAAYPAANSCSGFVAPPGPPICVGAASARSSTPSSLVAEPWRPPVTVTRAVYTEVAEVCVMSSPAPARRPVFPPGGTAGGGVPRSGRRGGSEQPRAGVVQALERGVVERDAADAAVGGERAGLRLDLLGREHAGHRREVRVAVHQLQVPGQLLDPVDVAAALDLDGDRAAARVAAQDVDRPDRGHVL